MSISEGKENNYPPLKKARKSLVNALNMPATVPSNDTLDSMFVETPVSR